MSQLTVYISIYLSLYISLGVLKAKEQSMLCCWCLISPLAQGEGGGRWEKNKLSLELRS